MLKRCRRSSRASTRGRSSARKFDSSRFFASLRQWTISTAVLGECRSNWDVTRDLAERLRRFRQDRGKRADETRRLEGLRLRLHGTDEREVPADALFVFVGQAPRTSWLEGVVRRTPLQPALGELVQEARGVPTGRS